jgi:hypothetical protein
VDEVCLKEWDDDDGSLAMAVRGRCAVVGLAFAKAAPRQRFAASPSRVSTPSRFDRLRPPAKLPRKKCTGPKPAESILSLSLLRLPTGLLASAKPGCHSPDRRSLSSYSPLDVGRRGMRVDHGDGRAWPNSGSYTGAMSYEYCVEERDSPARDGGCQPILASSLSG